MKNLRKLFVLAILLNSYSILAQSGFLCGTKSAYTTQTVSQPTNCVALLNDLIQAVNDRTVEVNVHFWVFVPSYTNPATSAWTYSADPTTSADAQSCLDVVNAVYASIPTTPQLTLVGTPTGIGTAKIKFLLKGFNVITSDQAYLNVQDEADGTYGYTHFDPNAINVFLGTQTSTFVSGGVVVSHYYGGNIGVPPPLNSSVPELGYPHNVIMVNPENSFTLAPWSDTARVARYANIRYFGGTLAHEFGHTLLGLDHTQILASINNSPNGCNCPGDHYYSIKPNFGCCKLIEANDYVAEDFPCIDNGTVTCKSQYAQQGCNTPGASDNMMSMNSGCYRYFSPQQMAIMHFNLRTILKDFLTANGYTAATTVNHSFDYTLTGDEIWNDGDRYFKGDIIIPSGKTLSITCGVAMAKAAKIIVRIGGLLVVDGGTITNISGTTWDGIHAEGSPQLSQSTTHSINANALQYQALVKILNGGTISNAVRGFRNYYSGEYYAGGVIIAQDANFINNGIDVSFSNYRPTWVQPALPSASRFYHCNFKTTDLMALNGAIPSHAKLLDSKGVQFYGCNFETTGTTILVNSSGIYSENSSYYVSSYGGTTPTTFKKMYKGVWVNNSVPLIVPTITRSKFENNFNAGAYFYNVYNLGFETNTLVVPSSNSSVSGVYLNSCKYYKIKNNTFTEDPNSSYKQSSGLCVINSKIGAHEVYKNTFSNFMMGINAMGDNSGLTNVTDGLRMICNSFTVTSNKYDVALNLGASSFTPSVAKKQGEVNPTSQTGTNVVRNTYGATCNSNQNQWYIHSSSTKTVDHGSNSQAITQPTCSSNLVELVALGGQII